jgi:AraC-like DNA-binding protein
MPRPGATPGDIGPRGVPRSSALDDCVYAALTVPSARPSPPTFRTPVAALASTAGMSRSAFAARFTRLVGEPAMHYVTRWKMHAARMWLAEGDASLGELASRLGYESEAAFCRAFKRFIGVSPGMVRRRERPVRKAS